MGHRDHYATLGVPRDAEISLIQATYWRLARQCNESLTSDPEAPLLLRDLNAAYEVLSTPQLRRQYDEVLACADVRAEVGPRPRSRLGSWRRRPLKDEKKKAEAQQAALQPEPAPTLMLGGIALSLCLVPWRWFRRLLERLAPRTRDPRPHDEGQRTAALRDSTAAIVARWRQSSMTVSDGRLWPLANPGASSRPSASQPHPDP
jgi:curved DNA-binding protein CbpA